MDYKTICFKKVYYFGGKDIRSRVIRSKTQNIHLRSEHIGCISVSINVNAFYALNIFKMH